MKKIIELKHELGQICDLICYRDVFEYKTKYPLSLELAYGIGAGLNFELISGYSYKLILGFNAYVSEEFCWNLDIFPNKKYYDNDAMALDDLKNSLLNDTPVIVSIDKNIYYHLIKPSFLDHNPSSKMLESTNLNLGNHVILVVGFDTDNVYFYEQDIVEIQRIPIPVFQEARNPFNKNYLSEMMAPRNQAVYLNFPSKTYPLEEAIIEGIQKNVFLMNHPVILKETYPKGFKGLELFLGSIPEYVFSLGPNDLIITISMIKNIPASRNLYCQFLRAASAILNDKTLSEAAWIYQELYKMWKNFSNDLSVFIHPNPQKKMEVSEISRFTTAIFDLEFKGIEILEKIISRNS